MRKGTSTLVLAALLLVGLFGSAAFAADELAELEAAHENADAEVTRLTDEVTAKATTLDAPSAWPPMLTALSKLLFWAILAGWTVAAWKEPMHDLPVPPAGGPRNCADHGSPSPSP